MGKRAQILVGMAAGMLWAFGLFFVTGEYLGPPNWGEPVRVIGGALWFGGVVLCLMIGRLAQRRFFDDQIIDGQPFAGESSAALDQKVLTNTVEQLVLALCLWPFIGLNWATPRCGCLDGPLPRRASCFGLDIIGRPLCGRLDSRRVSIQRLYSLSSQ